MSPNVINAMHLWVLSHPDQYDEVTLSSHLVSVYPSLTYANALACVRAHNPKSKVCMSCVRCEGTYQGLAEVKHAFGFRKSGAASLRWIPWCRQCRA
jgi:hypothetical protein